MTRLATAIGFTVLAFAASTAAAGSRVSHHGGVIVDCESPHFYDQTPAKDAKIATIQNFSLTASDNTDPETIKAWANNQPVAVKVTPQRSGQYLIEGHLETPVSKGKVWFRVNAESNDGCDENSVWTVYAGN